MSKSVWKVSRKCLQYVSKWKYMFKFKHLVFRGLWIFWHHHFELGTERTDHQITYRNFPKSYYDNRWIMIWKTWQCLFTLAILQWDTNMKQKISGQTSILDFFIPPKYLEYQILACYLQNIKNIVLKKLSTFSVNLNLNYLMVPYLSCCEKVKMAIFWLLSNKK